MFNANTNQRGTNQQSNTNFQPGRPVTQSNGPTQPQIKFYLNLCNQKSVEPNPSHTQFTVKQMSDEITRLTSMASPGYNNPNQQEIATDIQGFEKVSEPIRQKSYTDGPENVKATENQVQAMIKIGSELGLKANEQVLRNMSISQASAQMDKMISMRKTKVDAGPSERQLQMLSDMFNCPDIDYESFYRMFPVKEGILIEKSRLENQMKVLLRDDNAKDKDRIAIGDKIVELDKLIKQIIESTDWNQLSRRDVGNFIQDNQQVFYAWKDNQASPAQLNLILDLQKRLHTFTNNWNLNLDGLASDINGNQIDNRDELLSDFNEAIEFNLSEDDLLFATKDFAREYITQMQKELTRLSSPSPVESDREYEVKENALNEQQANELFEKEVVDMIYGLYAMLGQSAEDSTINSTNVDEKLKELIEMNITYANQVDPIKDYMSIRDYVDNFVDGVELFKSLDIVPAI